MRSKPVTTKQKQALASFLRRGRAESGLKLREVAERIGVTFVAINLYELGKAVPSAFVLFRLAKLYDLNLNEVARRSA